MTEMKLTYHARYERADRIAQILAILGIGEKLIDFPEEDKTYRLMNNGVLFIMDSRTQVVITAYVPSIKKSRRSIVLLEWNTFLPTFTMSLKRICRIRN